MRVRTYPLGNVKVTWLGMHGRECGCCWDCFITEERRPRKVRRNRNVCAEHTPGTPWEVCGE